MSSAPTVMVSSTFYDLRQIRADLAKFLSEDLGYIPLLSELLSFPVDPDLDSLCHEFVNRQRSHDCDFKCAKVSKAEPQFPGDLKVWNFRQACTILLWSYRGT